MRALTIQFLVLILSSHHAFAASSYVAERLQCFHRSYLMQPDGNRKKVAESEFYGRIEFKVNGTRHDYSIERHRFSPRISYTRAMEQLNPSLPMSAPSTDQVSVGSFTVNEKGERLSSRDVKINRGRSYGSTIIRERISVLINSTTISIAVRDRLTERWAGDATYIRTVTCRFANAAEAQTFMNSTY